MSEAGKAMTWTRWAVKIDAQHPPSTYEMLCLRLTENSRFKVVSMGTTDTQVRTVVEYTAAGANSDDIKRKFTTLGISRSAVETIKVACIETEWAFNADLIQAVDSTAAEVVEQVAVDVATAMQQAAPEEAMQVSWAVSMIDTYNEPILTGQALVNAQEYFAAAVA